MNVPPDIHLTAAQRAAYLAILAAQPVKGEVVIHRLRRDGCTVTPGHFWHCFTQLSKYGLIHNLRDGHGYRAGPHPESCANLREPVSPT